MLTIIIKRSSDPNTNLLTELNMAKELWNIKDGGEVLLEDSWFDGLKKVETDYVCLVEADCVLSAQYLSSNYGLMKKTDGQTGKGGGYTKLAMLASCIGIETFAKRIYNYKLEKVSEEWKDDISIKSWQIRPSMEKRDMKQYGVQIGYVPGAIIRMSSLQDSLENIAWNERNLLKLSMDLSFHFWGTGRRVEVNPNTTYVTDRDYLELPPFFDVKVPDVAAHIFKREGF